MSSAYPIVVFGKGPIVTFAARHSNKAFSFGVSKYDSCKSKHSHYQDVTTPFGVVSENEATRALAGNVAVDQRYFSLTWALERASRQLRFQRPVVFLSAIFGLFVADYCK